jgi:AraC-like DNA-binding protein
MSEGDKLPFSLFSTAQVRPREQFEAWHDSISVIFETSPLPERQPEHGFDASVRAHHLGGLLVTQVDFDGQRFRRDKRRLTLDGLDHYLVQLYATGGLTGTAEERERVLNDGDVQILDLSRTNATETKASTTIALVVPRDTLREALPTGGELHGLVLRGNGGTGGLLADYMRSLVVRADAITIADAPTIAQATTDMIAACFQSTAASVARARSVLETTLLVRIQRHIATALGSPRLGPEALCAVFRISRTQLYRLFEPIGGVAAYIQEQRLARAHADFGNPAKAHLRVYEIAYQWGFTSEAHFSRVFRRTFGITPGDARSRSEGRPIAAARDMQGLSGEHAYEGWVRSLHQG